MRSNGIGVRWYKDCAAIFLAAFYFNWQKINNIKTEGHSLWKELHQCKNRTDKAKRDYNHGYPKGQMKSCIMMFLKTKKCHSLNHTPNVSQFFKLRGEDCSKRCYNISLKSIKSLSEKGNYSTCRHTSGKFVPYLLLKVKLAGAGSKLLLTNSSPKKQNAPVLTGTAETGHKEWTAWQHNNRGSEKTRFLLLSQISCAGKHFKDYLPPSQCRMHKRL